MREVADLLSMTPENVEKTGDSGPRISRGGSPGAAHEDAAGSPKCLVRGQSEFLAERIGFVFQSFNLFANLDARGNIHLPTALLPRSRLRNAKDPDALLRELGLDRRARHLPGELSGGQQQRVASRGRS